MILLIDNYDSFVHNLARYLQRLGQITHVVRNDAMTAADVAQLQPRAIVISPGPCTPTEAGCSVEIIRQVQNIPTLGVCLGHQAIAVALGGKVVRAVQPMHGRASTLEHDGKGLFAGLPPRFEVGRYHSLVVDEGTLPPELQVTARTDDGVIMAIAHRQRPLFGVQFHPESILTEHGYELLANFLRLAGLAVPQPLPTQADERPATTTTGIAWPDRPVTF